MRPKYGGLNSGMVVRMKGNLKLLSFLLIYLFVDEKEVGTDGKLLLLGCENSTLQGYALQSKQKVGFTCMAL